MRNARSTANGVERTEAHDTIATSTSAKRNPTSGDSTIASSAFDSPLQISGRNAPALAMPPPTRPPISACELEDGIPNPQVIRFQTIAPTRAAKIVRASTTFADDPAPMVWATLRPNTPKATKLKNAAHSTAYCGRSTRVETIVAIESAASRNPLRNRTAARLRSILAGGSEDQAWHPRRGPCSYTCSITILLISLATSSKRSATFSRWS